MHKKGISLKSVEKSLSHSANKIRRRTFLCFERILVSKSFKGGGKLYGFVENFFYLTGPKKLRQGTIVFQKISGREKYFTDKRGVSRFSVEVFVSLYRKISLENTLVIQKNSFIQKFSCIGGGRGITVLSKFFVLQDRNEKLCKGTRLFPGNFLVSKKIYG